MKLPASSHLLLDRVPGPDDVLVGGGGALGVVVLEGVEEGPLQDLDAPVEGQDGARDGQGHDEQHQRRVLKWITEEFNNRGIEFNEINRNYNYKYLFATSCHILVSDKNRYYTLRT